MFTMKRLCFLILAISTIIQVQAQNAFDKDFRKLALSLAYIQSYYVDKVSGNKVVEDAIMGMLEKPAPHSAYTNAQ